jgi:hypothetical protein
MAADWTARSRASRTLVAYFKKKKGGEGLQQDKNEGGAKTESDVGEGGARFFVCL